MDDDKSKIPTLPAKELQKAHDDGEKVGYARGVKEILDWLEDAYIKDTGRPNRGTPEAKAILELARSAASHFRLKLKKHGNRG